jgi:thiol-disulfide isomerase/thioredoxin
MSLSAALVLALLCLPTASQDAPVLLDFHAEWCGPCKQMRPAVEQLMDRGYPVKSVDIDRSKPLAEKYGIEQVPTFVVVAPDGRELGRVSGARPAAELAELYNEASNQLARSRPRPEAEREEAEDEDGTAEDDEALPANPKPWQTVVRIKIKAPRAVGFGSGTIIRSTPEETIILTCAHIFHIDGARQQPPPSKFPYKIHVDLFDGQLHGLKPAQVHPQEENLVGQAIDYDFATDVGLIRIRPGRKLPASLVVPPDWAPKKGMKLTTVGCSEGHDATAWTTYITNPRFKGLVGRTSYEAIECLHDPKQGRSGGGLYTLDGYVAGVCDFAEPRGKRGLYASPRSIHRLLDRNNLQVCYNPSAASRGVLADSGRRRGDSGKTTLRAQNDPIPTATGRIPMPEPERLGVRLDPVDDDRRATTRRAERPAAASGPGWQVPAGAVRLTAGAGRGRDEGPAEDAVATDHETSPAVGEAGSPATEGAIASEERSERVDLPISGGWKAVRRGTGASVAR